MKPLVASTAILVMLALADAARAGPNLVANGSFEQGTAGIGSFTGWTVALGDDGTFVDSNGQTGARYGQATDGRWSAFFGSTRADGGATISQVFSTVRGQTLVLSFDIADDNGGGPAADAFAALVDGVALYAAVGLAAQNYVHRSFTFTGTGAPTRLAFQGYNDNGYVELDNVVVSAVPEPAGWTLAPVALAAAALARRARRRPA